MTTVPNFLAAFPDFDHEFPAMGEGWTDASWKNDTCPSLFNRALRLVLWVDFKNEAIREFDGGSLFTLCDAEAEGGSLAPVLETNDLAEVRAWVEANADARARQFLDEDLADDTDELTAQLVRFCMVNGLPYMSADELHAEVATAPRDERDPKVEVQLHWLARFVDHWQDVQAVEDAAFRARRAS